jgi:uncharacterized membrane protein
MITLILGVAIFIGAHLIPTRHPMLWGVTIWAAAHLLANGALIEGRPLLA